MLQENDFLVSNLTYKYCLVEKARARRHDNAVSPYEYWQVHTDEVISAAILSYRYYGDGNELWDQPHEIQEQEAYFRLLDLKGPSLFSACLAVGLIKHFRATKVLDMARAGRPASRRDGYRGDVSLVRPEHSPAADL